MPVQPTAAASQFRTLEETSGVTLAPDAVLKPDAVKLNGGVLTVQNAELAQLIHSKLAAASQLAAKQAAPAAADADVSVSVKVHF
jgi:hypothetical protein